jgi:hypothetical protein
MKKIILVFSLVMLSLIACSQTNRTTFEDIVWAKLGIKFGDGTIQSTAAGGGTGMIYPSAGIPISTGTAWSTSITNNSANWNTAFSWGNHAGLYRGATWVPTFSQVTSKPTTISGYGITDAALSTHTHTFTSLTSKPTTLSGYGITDAKPLSYIPTYAEITGKPTLFDGTWTSLTGKPLTFIPTSHTHDYNTDIINKPPTESLSVALAGLPGMKLPRLTQAQIDALTPTTTDAILVVNTTVDALQYWTGTQWVIIVSNK